MATTQGVERDKDIKQQFAQLYNEVHKVIIGNDEVIEDIVIALFAGGHILLESVPGMGKTVLTNTISDVLECEFKRLQGTPDLTAKDITGEMRYDENTRQYTLRKGAVFTNILLMDEINRAPPKTQSALLEAMEEKHISISGKTYPLPQPFVVIATQNPLEQEGVYPLPEAQQDRFMFKSVLKYLSTEEEVMIMKSKSGKHELGSVFNPAEIQIIQKEIEDTVFMSDSILDYVVRVIDETRQRRELATGASPRASIAFMRGAKARAFIEGRDHVKPQDIRKLAFPIMRHRVILYPEYADTGTTTDDVISKILQKVQAPMM